MSQTAYALLGLSALVGLLAGVLAFALMRVVVGLRDVRARLQRDGSGTELMLPAIEEAVARLRAQERAMTERAEASERLSDQIITSLTSGLLVVGLDRRVRILNPAGHRLLGVRAGSAPGDVGPLLAHLPPLADLIEQALGTGAALVRRVLAVPPAPGLPTHLGVGVSPLADGTGRLQGVICLFSDLSDIVDLEEQVRLKDSLSRLGELTAGLAHEFRNGLSTIHGYARLMDPDRLPESYRPCLAGIRAETDTLGEVVTNFLGFARPAELALAPVDLGAVARRLAEDARGEASGGHIQVAGDFGLVEGDEVLLRQAIDNLLRNAIEACREASLVASIRIDGHRDDARRVVRVTVSDNGPGFDPQMMPRLFKPFATSRRAGTGLGLALVQKIIVSHNGRVTASRAPDGGAMVQIELPLSAAERVSGL